MLIIIAFFIAVFIFKSTVTDQINLPYQIN